MKEQKINIEIDSEGSLKADAEGFSGDTCLKDLERLLDGLATGFEEVVWKHDDRDHTVSHHGHRTLVAGRKP